MTPPTPLLDQFVRESATSLIISDGFSEIVTAPTVHTPDDVLRRFFMDTPPWLVSTLKLRNEIVSRFGFDTGTNQAPVVPERSEVGERLSVFTVMARSDDEILLGIDDTRMEMRLSIAISAEPRTLTLATAARPVDKVGARYLRLVKLGHGPVAKMMAKRCARP